MQSTRPQSPHIRPWLIALALALALIGAIAHSRTLSPPDALRAEYENILPHLLHNSFGVPVYVKSHEQDNMLSADIYGQLNFSMMQLETLLNKPSGWCELLSLTLNVKACVYQENPEQLGLTLYMGRKYYQSPQQATPMHYDFHREVANADYFAVALTAPKGPLGTRNYRIDLQAIPITTGTLLRIHSEYHTSTTSRLATATYLATLGRSKIGFSSEGTDDKGQPKYVGGVRGIIERNTMRDYLALQAVLENQDLPPQDRFEAEIKRWFDLTEHYPDQLHELERSEYLQAKRKEHDNQLRLQAAQR